MAKTDKERPTVSVEELVVSHSFQLSALIELLEERGILTRSDVLGRIRLLRDRKKPN